MDLNEVRIAQVSVLLEQEPDMGLPDAVPSSRFVSVAALVLLLDLLALFLILD